MAGPKPRESYNAKARQSTAGSRKKGKIRKGDKPQEPEDYNPNAAIITPKSQEQKETERKEKLLQELAAQSDSKWTTKKKKRLEKYIDKKLKKEERVLIFEKLTKTQASVPLTVLQSSATLGTGKPLTHQEQQDRDEDALVCKSLLGQTGKRKRHQDNYDVVENNSEIDEEEDVGVVNDDAPKFQFAPQDKEEVVVKDTSTTPSEKPSHTQLSVGSALQRNPDGSIVQPKFRSKSKGKQSYQRSWGKAEVQEIPSESDTSFDSSGSENDESENSENEDDGSAASSNEASEEVDAPPVKKKALGFKEWATKQLNAAKGFEPPAGMEKSSLSTPDGNPPPKKKRRLDGENVPREMRGPLGEDLLLPSTSFTQQLLNGEPGADKDSRVKVVEVKRPPEVEEARVLLPIVTEEQPIMEAILLNPVVIICGETGSGKTTQVPQFLYEAGFGTPGSDNPGMIGITQPRRVAAMSMAARVGHELSLTSSRVSYQIRYDATVSPSTSIKFMTDGVLLRELATDFLLTKYSVIIVDEAHERSINTDILIGVLSRVIKLREDMWKKSKDNVKPLRLIIMSATMRVGDFAENKNLFPSTPPIINVAARQHPVTIHFSRRTCPDYVTQAVKKASKIHTRLPPGGILIFLTGQAEITGVCRKLETKFGKKTLEEKKRRRGVVQQDAIMDPLPLSADKRGVNAAQADVEPEEVELGYDTEENLAFDVGDSVDQREDPEDLESEGDDEQQLSHELGLDDDTDAPMYIVPLYSLLSSDKQMRVFEPPPAGYRLVVVSTNIAETSLTIPGIRYVVDCGRAKERHYDMTNGIQSFQVSWISKASASQRAGRAGRTGPGHCYRLYSSALFENHFEKFATPEIRRTPIDGVVLQMKSMHIDAVINFPFPTPPDKTSLQKAEKTLLYLGALKLSSSHVLNENGTQITDLGRAMTLFPVSPRFSRMLVSGQQHGCLPYVICIISALSVGDPFIYEDALAEGDASDLEDTSTALKTSDNEAVVEKERRLSLRKAFFKTQHVHASLGNLASDLFKLLSVVGAYEYAGGGQKFCAEHFIRPKAMEEIHKLRAQISSLVHANFPKTDPCFIPHLPPPNDHQIKVLRQLLTAGFIDQVAVRKDLVDRNDSSGTQLSTSKNVPYRALGVQEDVYIHPSSILANLSPPDYVVYHEIVRTSRVYVKGLTKINPTWLSTLGKDTLCTFSKPIKNNVGTLMTIPKFGPDGWELPAIKAN
ncbi:P-loop containing nucleoside triphosphate hydrolase protein [Gymnopilus junonius]|uniref:RNA helicase n=1 Tax=Gymnopilus junonius TaxID=109634 RepID=A0A9P5NUD1_GYMJU|nr:P-loop containing nucleoside triphosphate hydrolase protein [Gymnopilus junonius]